MPSPTDPTTSPPDEVDLVVRGTLPSGLSGRLLGIGPDGVVHSVQVHGGRVAYVSRRVRPDTVVGSLVAFEGSILAIGDDSSVHELRTDVDTLPRVDLAGHGRGLATTPRYDAVTGELHLLARDSDGAQTHVVVAAGALTRRSRPIADAPRSIRDLALSREHAVVVADGVVGVTPRDGEARTTWIATHAAAPHPVHAHRAGDDVVLFVLTPSLERWTLNPRTGAVRRDVIDPTARHFARCSGTGSDGAPRYVWTTGDETIGRHDVVESRSIHLCLAPDAPGDFVLVPDGRRFATVDAGWFVGVVHDAASGTTDLRVIDMADLLGPAVATVRIPRALPDGLRCEWMPPTAL